MDTLLALLAVAIVVLFWSDSIKAREVAFQRAARACKETGVQLLDQTVALRGLRPVRADNGAPGLLRTYGFEFTRDGVARHGATVWMLGRRVQSVQMDFPEGRTILDQTVSTPF